MKWRGGGFNNLRRHGRETGQGPRRRVAAPGYHSQSVGYKPELFEKCARPGCGLTRLDHERGPLLPDHDFQPA